MDKKKTENNPFTVPENYFIQLHDQVMARVAEDKLKEQGIGEGFSVPSGYFETLHQRILAAKAQEAAAGTAGKRAVQVKELHPRRWISYATAACITIALATVALWQIPKKSGNDFEQHIAALSDADIINYLQYYSEAGDGTSLAEQVNVEPENFGESYSQEELENYLDQTL